MAVWTNPATGMVFGAVRNFSSKKICYCHPLSNNFTVYARKDAVSEWQASLVKPFLDRVHSRLQVTAEPDSALAARLGRILAYRVTEVRWGPDAVEEMALRNDPDLRAASNYTNRISEELSGRH